MRELLELPEWAQRSVLGGVGGGAGAGGEWSGGVGGGSGRGGGSPHVVAFFNSCDVRSDTAPLPVEAVLGVIQRVMET